MLASHDVLGVPLMEPADPHFVEVYRPRTAAIAHLLGNRLEQEGFEVLIENAFLDGMEGNLTMSWAMAPRILVPAMQALRARTLLEEWEADQAYAEEEAEEEGSRCLSCGAPFPEDASACPRCGWSFKKDGEA